MVMTSLRGLCLREGAAPALEGVSVSLGTPCSSCGCSIVRRTLGDKKPCNILTLFDKQKNAMLPPQIRLLLKWDVYITGHPML